MPISRVATWLYSLFLFTKSDIKTTLIPITFFAAAAAPIQDIGRLPHTVFWIWLHLLQFDVSNQTMLPEEDLLNKGDRPLPSKRVTLTQALVLRWLLVPACWAVSASYSVEVLYASIALVFLTVIYNECGAHASHWFIRNIVNAAGFASFEAGSTLIAGHSARNLKFNALLSICISAGIFATTIQSQDFKDEHGDRAIGRKTIPIVHPSISHYTVIIPVFLWSVGLSYLWRLNLVSGFIFVSTGVFVGKLFLVSQTVPEYQRSFYWYNVWLSMAHALPGYYYFHGTE